MTDIKKNYTVIQDHYESKLREHGPNHRGVDWPNQADLNTRFDVMLGVMNTDDDTSSSLTDLGCGVGLLADHLIQKGLSDRVHYQGIDISEAMIERAKQRHPSLRFEARDILEHPLENCADYVVMNGVLTEKLTLSYDEMEAFAQRMLEAAFRACRVGMAFNVMNHHVDWQREDLFHWPLDSCAGYIVNSLSRHVAIRMDYGLYEYTVYVYKEARKR